MRTDSHEIAERSQSNLQNLQAHQIRMRRRNQRSLGVNMDCDVATCNRHVEPDLKHLKTHADFPRGQTTLCQTSVAMVLLRQFAPTLRDLLIRQFSI